MRPIIIGAVLWIVPWALIIAVNVCYISISKRNDATDEIVKDGNSQFTTGLVYFIGTVICYFVHIGIVRWILIGLGAICCVPPLISVLLTMIPQAALRRDAECISMAISASISAFAQAGMIVNVILFTI